MYGCSPCPKCQSKYRVPYKLLDAMTVDCNDCGYRQAGQLKDDVAPANNHWESNALAQRVNRSSRALSQREDFNHDDPDEWFEG